MTSSAVNQAEKPTPAGVEAPAAMHVEGSGRQRKPARLDDSNKFKIRALARWLFMLASFIYLLALAMTLFEIDAFQNQVAEMATTELGARAGNARQREVLQAVRSTEPREKRLSTDDGKPADPNQELYVRVAAKLDPMWLAIDMLTEIGSNADFEARGDDVFKRAQEEMFRELARRLESAVAELRKEVPELGYCDSPAGADDCEELDEVYSNLQVLQDGAAELGSAVSLVSAQTGLRGVDSDQLVKTVRESTKEIRRAARDLGRELGSIEDLPDFNAIALSESLASLSGGIERLRDITGDEALGLSRQAYARPSAADSSGEVQGPGLEALGAVALNPGARSPEVAKLRRILRAAQVKGEIASEVEYPADQVLRETMDDGVVAGVREFQRLRGLGVDGGVGENTRPLLNQLVTECNAAPQRCGLSSDQQPADGNEVSLGKQLTQLDAALKRLDGYVTNYAVDKDLDLQEVGKLTRELAKIEVASRQLAGLEIKVRETGAGDGELRRRYQAALAKLSTSIGSMRQSLNDNTDAGIIADAIGEDDPNAYRKALTLDREFDALDRYQSILTPLYALRLRHLPECAPQSSVDDANGETTDGESGTTPNQNDSDDKTPVELPKGCPERYIAGLWNSLANTGFHAKDMATMTRQGLDMLVVFVMGAIGSLMYLIRYLLTQTLQNPDKGSPVWRPLSWYLFRPVFGIVVAFGIYLLYKTGQVALGGANANVLSSDVNLPILSVFSLFAGLLSWQALEMVESKGRRWLAAQRRENLWASGLRAALRRAGKTEADCAAQVGVTPIQVERWIAGNDMVTPEKQDRIVTWLDRQRVEIFSNVNPRDIDESTLAWATGLKKVLKSNPAGIDIPRLAQLVEQDVATVHAWADMKRQVDSEMQFLIADKLGMSRDDLFSPERPDAESWAVGLRNALHGGNAKLSTAADLAQAVGSTPRRIRRYMELREGVPKAVQNLIAAALDVEHKLLFSSDQPLDRDYKWATKLRECLQLSGLRGSAEVAETLDVEQSWVRAWMEQETCGEEDPPYCGQVPPATQPMLARALGCEPQTLFRAERPESDFRWAVMPRFRELVDARGGVGEMAQRLDLDAGLIERWMSGAESVALDTQMAVVRDLQLPVDELTELFTRQAPPDPSRPRAALWATGLRAAVRANPNIRTLDRLAAELQIQPKQLYDAAEMLEPVNTTLRDGITRVLGASAPGVPALFSNQAPDWQQFRWVPQLRDAMAAKNLTAEALAERLDVDLPRVQDWMEMDPLPADTLWAKDKVKRGQICPATCTELLELLGGVSLTAEQLFDAQRPDSGSLWTVQPTFEMAVRAAEGGLAGFADQVEAEPARVERWIAQTEPVTAATQRRILKALGLDAGDAWQIFSSVRGARKRGLG